MMEHTETRDTRPRDWLLETKTGPLTLYGVRLAAHTSHERLHTHLAPHAARYEKCHACRWTEIAIYRQCESARELSLRTHPSRTGSPEKSLELRRAGPVLGDYVVHTVGRSAVPGEDTWFRVVRAPRPADVIESLIVTKDKGTHTDRFITRPAQDALESAARVDDQLDRELGVWVESDAARRVSL